MIQKSNGSSRRILTYPAVHPCDSISAVTLLNSLIDLGRDICSYKSKFFSTNKRNARETFRQITNLLLFLEEIRNATSDPLDPVILSLSELHLTFQKIRYLSEDCTRDGARAWMMVISDRVANQFQMVIRAMGTGLDVFPLSTVDVSNESKELFELITRHARKTNLESDPEDKKAVKDLMRILHRFEEGSAPDPVEIKRILDHLGIKKWSDCNNEVKFLASEIEIEFSNRANKRDLELLSSLMGFMSYCRCVIFDSVDCQSQHLNGQYNSSEALKGINGEDLKCPISLEMMSDPVILSTGHTYDRSSIIKWFSSGNATCPKTGKKLTNTVLIPNLVVKGMIQQYSAERGVAVVESSRKNRDISRTVMAGILAGEGAMKMLVVFLVNKLVNGSTVEEMNKAAFEIRALTKTSIFNRSCLVEAGAVPHLLKLSLSKDSNTQENSIAGLLNLSKHWKSKSVIVENEGLDMIVHVLRNGLKMEAQQHAAAILFYLASVEENRVLIGENQEAIPGLVELVRSGNDGCKRNALVAIFGLLVHPENHWRVLAAGVVPLLLNLLKDSQREDLETEYSLAVLASLAEKVDGTVAIIRRAALQMLVGILNNSSTSRTAKEYCVSLLLALCVNGGLDVVARLVNNPSLMGSLYSQLSEGTCRASKKASALIRILHQFYERTSSTSVTPLLPRERFVHVW